MSEHICDCSCVCAVPVEREQICEDCSEGNCCNPITGLREFRDEDDVDDQPDEGETG